MNAYGVNGSTLLFTHSYLDSREQRVVVNCSFSMWAKTCLGVPQCSVLWPLLFNKYLNYILFFLDENEVCNYADDTAIYTCGPNFENVVAKLENDALALSEWFPNNCMKINEDHYHLMSFGGKSDKVSIKIGEANVNEHIKEMLLGIVIDQTLSFKQHVRNLCKKTTTSCLCQNILLHGHRRVEAGNASRFSCSPLVRMFYDWTLSHRINHIHERWLRFAYNHY